MEFKLLFKTLKNRLADGDDIPYFFREIMAMITEVTEEEWGVNSKDPSKLISDNTIRNYAKRGISKKVADKIVYRLTPKVLVNRINERPQTTLELLADDFISYDSTVDANNVAEKIGDWLVDSIRMAAGLAPVSELEKQKQLQSSQDLKIKYGDYLCREANGYCPLLGCGRMLTVNTSNKIKNVYEVTLIDKNKESNVENTIALCPQCFATYQLDNSVKVMKQLKTAKKTLSTQLSISNLLNTTELEKGLASVISKLQKLNQKNLYDVTLDPKDIIEKINPDDNIHLYNIVKNSVTMYYVKIKEIMMNLDKRGVIDYDSLQHQMKSLYKKLKKSKSTDIEIFEAISNKIHKTTLQNMLYCQIIVCYFIQSCEVFDAITK